ncbi:hypothetical protein D3C84_1206230 [compost metagenome]
MFSEYLVQDIDIGQSRQQSLPIDAVMAYQWVAGGYDKLFVHHLAPPIRMFPRPWPVMVSSAPPHRRLRAVSCSEAEAVWTF